MRVRTLVLGSVAAVGAAHYLATVLAKELAERPELHPIEKLLADPPGDQAIIEREEGTRLSTWSAGTGPTVVLAHGLLLDGTSWSTLAHRLVDLGFRVVTFDQRGHGRSRAGTAGVGAEQMAEDYRAVIDHHEVTDGVLVGHSMGTFLAIKYLLDHPDHANRRLKGAVLVAPLAGKAAHRAPQNKIQIPMLRSGLMRRMLNTRTYGWLLTDSTMSDASPAMLEAVRAVMASTDHEGVLPILDALVEESLYERLDEISMPVRVICGTADRTTPDFHSRDIVNGVQDGSLTSVNGAGHMLMWESADEVIKEIQLAAQG